MVAGKQAFDAATDASDEEGLREELGRTYVPATLMPGESPDALTDNTELLDSGILDFLALVSLILRLARTRGLPQGSRGDRLRKPRIRRCARWIRRTQAGTAYSRRFMKPNYIKEKTIEMSTVATSKPRTLGFWEYLAYDNLRWLIAGVGSNSKYGAVFDVGVPRSR